MKLTSSHKRRITQLFNEGRSNVDIRDELREKIPKLRTATIKTRREQYFKGKTDKLITELFTGQPCVICKSQGIICTDTVGHHLVERSLSAYHRHNIWNIIPLCQNHHLFSNELAAHSSYAPAQVAFVEWLKGYMPKQHFLLTHYKSCELKIDYERAYHRLQKYLAGDDNFGEDIFMNIEK